jgi:hypothetical protein
MCLVAEQLPLDQRGGALDQAEAVVALAAGGGEAPLVGEEREVARAADGLGGELSRRQS